MVFELMVRRYLDRVMTMPSFTCSRPNLYPMHILGPETTLRLIIRPGTTTYRFTYPFRRAKSWKDVVPSSSRLSFDRDRIYLDLDRSLGRNECQLWECTRDPLSLRHSLCREFDNLPMPHGSSWAGEGTFSGSLKLG